jgi:Flp pilus assembly protein CpaB
MLQDLLVLQVGPWSSGSSDSKNAASASLITFALDRQDALTLKSAREQGQIDLILRRAGDHKVADTEPVTLQYLNKRFKFNLTPPSQSTTLR